MRGQWGHVILRFARLSWFNVFCRICSALCFVCPMSSAQGARTARFAVWQAKAPRGRTSAQRPRSQCGTHARIPAVDPVLAKARANPTWRGEDSQAGGQPRVLTHAQPKRLVELVFKMRGRVARDITGLAGLRNNRGASCVGRPVRHCSSFFGSA